MAVGTGPAFQMAQGDTSDAPPSYQGSKSTSVSQPIGVPYYITDPTTGQPQVGPDGQPLRWGATVSGVADRFAGRTWADTLSNTYQLPRYFDGDQWLPAQLPPDLLANLQKKMVAAGLLKAGEAQLGIWDTASMSAYTKLLGYANASGFDAQTALDRWGQAAVNDPTAKAAGKQRNPLVVQLTNPDDLRATFRKAVIDTLGQGWSQDKIDQMVNAYQQVETDTQQQKYQMTGSGSAVDMTTGLPVDPGTGGTITAPANPADYATAQARTENPELAQEHDALGMLGSFQQMIGNWSTVK